MKPEKINLWPGPAPVGNGVFDPATPSITVYRPSLTNGTSIVICPGGGYSSVVIEPEGHGIARWLNGYGITGIVLDYRLPQGRPFVPLLDAQRAIRMARSQGREWNGNPNRLGIMGFSAGGHLAATAGNRFDSGNPNAADPIERFSCRPDFMILIYPLIRMDDKKLEGCMNSLLGTKPDAELKDLFSCERQVTRQTPPAFLAHARNDTIVSPDHSRLFAEALRTKGVATEYLELPEGDHGLNGYQGPMWDAWQASSMAWLACRMKTPDYQLAAD